MVCVRQTPCVLAGMAEGSRPSGSRPRGLTRVRLLGGVGARLTSGLSSSPIE